MDERSGAAAVMGLTPRQAQTLAYLRAYTAEHGRAPLLSEMAAELGFSSYKSGSLDQLLAALQQRGFIRRRLHKQRGVKLLPATVVIRGERFRFIWKTRAASTVGPPWGGSTAGSQGVGAPQRPFGSSHGDGACNP